MLGEGEGSGGRISRPRSAGVGRQSADEWRAHAAFLATGSACPCHISQSAVLLHALARQPAARSPAQPSPVSSLGLTMRSPSGLISTTWPQRLNRNKNLPALATA